MAPSVQQQLRIAAGLLDDAGSILLRLYQDSIAVGENTRRFFNFFRHRYPHLINNLERTFLVHHRVPAERDMLSFVDQIFQPIHQMLDVHVTLPANYGDLYPVFLLRTQPAEVLLQRLHHVPRHHGADVAPQLRNFTYDTGAYMNIALICDHRDRLDRSVQLPVRQRCAKLQIKIRNDA